MEHQIIEEDITKSSKRGFAKITRKLLFWLIFIINLFNHLDHGAIAACTTYLMTELNLDHADLGIVGSLVYLGLTCGASLAGMLFSADALMLWSRSVFGERYLAEKENPGTWG